MNIEVKTEKDAYTQGESVHGEVIISTGGSALNGDFIKVKLGDYVEGTGAGAGYSGKKDESELMSDFAFSSRTEQRIPFTVKLPNNCRFSRESSRWTHDAEGWIIIVEVKSSNFKKQSHKHYIQVNPARELTAILETFENDRNFKKYSNSPRIEWSMYDSMVRFMMNSTDIPNSPPISFLCFSLLQGKAEGVSGTIELHLQPRFAKSLKERMRALVRLGPSFKRPFKLTNSQIFLPNGEVNHESITKEVNRIIEKVVASRS